MKRIFRAVAALVFALTLLFAAALSVAALDDTYRFDDFGMSVKLSKNYYVITRDTPADDPVFASLKLDREQTMKTFEQADIYLRAYDPEGIFQLSLTISSDDKSKSINNYADLSDAERRDILEALLAQPSVTAATLVKHGNFTFYDSSRTSTVDKEPLYINQCNTIVNGLHINLSLQKPKEPILASEAKVLTAAASSIEFDKVNAPDSGPVFDWWRMLLWVVILVALSAVISVIYHRRNAAKQRLMEERRRRHNASPSPAPAAQTADTAAVEEKPITFDEALGYRDSDRFSSRAATDLDTFDINVRERNPARGIVYFEDEGKSIDDRTPDYFETYFKEPTPMRSGIARLFSTVGAHIGIFFRHIGYFFRNLGKRITGKKKKS